MKSRENEKDAIFDNPFEDEVFATPIANPMITPQGTTYEHTNIQIWIDLHSSDPFNRTRLKSNQLLTNNLFLIIKNLFTEEKLDLEKLRAAFSCPLSKMPFQHPVVAQDGNTYELAFIQAYVEHFGKTPQGKKQRFPYYPNRFVESMLTVVNDLIIKDSLVSDTLIRSISNYLEARAIEKRYTGSIFGYSKWAKLEAGALLKATASGYLSADTLFSAKNKLATLKQGKFNDVATPVLDCLRRTKT